MEDFCLLLKNINLDYLNFIDPILNIYNTNDYYIRI